jgi:hypothetical protein
VAGALFLSHRPIFKGLTQLVSTLREGDVVILDNLSSHKSPGVAQALRDVGA